MTLVLVADPKSDEPKGYMLERIGVTAEPNTRHITNGTWKRIKDANRLGANMYELDSQAPAEYRRFWAIDRSTLLVLKATSKYVEVAWAILIQRPTLFMVCTAIPARG
jgi:hypothetical protein